MSNVADERFTVAFYGIDTSPSAVEGFYRVAVQLFVELGYPPDRLGYSSESRRNGVSGFQRINARLTNEGFAGVKTFDVHTGKPNAVISGLDYFALATFDRDGGPGYAVVSIPSSEMKKRLWPTFVRDLVRTLKPSYGIGYLRPLGLGPTLYALGIIYGEGPVFDSPAEDEEALNRSRWCDMAMPMQVYLEGVLRDVYAWNFLTKPQLHAKIGDASLQRWIEADSARGSLFPFVDDVWFWEIDEKHIPSVRAALKGLIFNWRNYP